MVYSCPYCDKTLKSERGVTQHINQTPVCLKLQQQQVSAQAAQLNRAAPVPPPLRRSQRRQSQAAEDADPRKFASPKIPPNPPDQDDDDIHYEPDDASTDASQVEPIPRRADVVGTSGIQNKDPLDTTSSEEEDSKPHAKVPPNEEILWKFRKYCDEHQDKFLHLSKEDKSSIKLMDVLRRKAPLYAFELVIWNGT